MGVRIYVCAALASRIREHGFQSVAAATLSFGRSENEARGFAYATGESRWPASEGWDSPSVIVTDMSDSAPQLLAHLLEGYGLQLNEAGAIVRESGEVVAELRTAGGAA